MKLILSAITILLISICNFVNAQQNDSHSIQAKLQRIENAFGGKIGVYALNTQNNQVIAYHANERFPIQSTMKLMGVAALLKKNESNPNLLKQTIHYTKDDLMFWHPVTGKYLKEGMTLNALSEAAMVYSDNPAMNLILQQLGGPHYITRFAHSIGNKTFNIVHDERALNSNPEERVDTSTPYDMAISLQKLALGNVLAPSLRTKLVTWMQANTTGNKRIRAGVPIGWTVADKTGSGDYGIANDIGIMWSPLCKPIVLAIYTVQKEKDAKKREDVIAETTHIILDEFAKRDRCFTELNN